MRRLLRSWLWRVPIDEEVDEELAFHIEMRRRELVGRGMAPGQARELAERRVAELARVRRVCAGIARRRDREMRMTQWVEELWSDVRFALRQLRISPGFTALAAVTLALGVGANSAIFALVDATLLRPLPYDDPDRLTMIWEGVPSRPRGAVAPLDFHDFHQRNRTFESMAAVYPYARRMTAADGSAEQIPAQQVTPGFFDMLRVRPVLGRAFLPSDVAVPPHVAILSEGLWRGRFGADPGVLGRVIQLDAQPFTVVGVMPADFQTFGTARLWTVWAEIPGMDSRGNRFMQVVGRLAPGVSLAAAQSDLDQVAAGLAREYPATNKDRGVTVAPLRDGLVGTEVRSTSLLFLGVVGFVLLMCCANVANLLLARTSSRARELAVRSALGAGRLRIVIQLLTESLALAGVGGLLALGVSAAILRAAPSLIPAGILPPSITLSFDGRVALFCGVTALLTGILFGIAPAWQATGTSLIQTLSSEGRAATRGGSRLRSLLVVGEVAAAVLLLCGAGLLLRTLTAIHGVDPGYRAERVLTMVPSIDYALPTSMFRNEDALRQFFDGVEREVSSVAGVERVGWGTSLPLLGFSATPFSIVGEEPPAESPLIADRQMVSPGYLPTLGVRMVAGRGFTAQDTVGGPPVCIVSASLARQHFGGRNPIGMRITVGVPQIRGRQAPVAREIVGIADDVRRTVGQTEESRSIYIPLAQSPWSFVVFVIRPSAGSAEALAPAVRAALARVDRRVPITQVRALDDVVWQVAERPRFRAALVTTFAALALALTMVGVFGVLAYSVQQRSREFGVRIALGATTGNVLRLVLATAARLIGGGMLVGLVLAALLAQSISAFLFGVAPLDPVTFAAAALILGVTAAVAAAIPARGASHVDPVVAFRNE
jgi:putative ABC transport system permease protein